MKIRLMDRLKIVLGWVLYKTTPVFDAKYFFLNRSVSVVGPGNQLLGSGLGREIDSAAVVIKFNRMVWFGESSKSHYGSRCNLLFHGLLGGESRGYCGVIDPVEWKNRNVGSVVYPFFLGVETYRVFFDYYCAGGLAGPKLFRVKKKEYFSLEREVGARPTSGYVAVRLALSVPSSIVKVYGFSFFKTPHFREYFNDGEDDVPVNASEYFHNPEREKELLIEHGCSIVP